MKNNSDKMYEKFKNLDFANAQPVELTTQLQRLQAMAGVKSRTTMRVDSSVLKVQIFEFLVHLVRIVFHSASVG